jgi:hypothetical protein
VREALTASRIAALSVPTLADGESYRDLLADRRALEDFDVEAAARPGPRRGAPQPARRRAPAGRPADSIDRHSRIRATKSTLTVHSTGTC